MGEQIKKTSIGSQLRRFAPRILLEHRCCGGVFGTEGQNCDKRLNSKDGYIKEFYIELTEISHHAIASKSRFTRGKFEVDRVLPLGRFQASILAQWPDSLFSAAR
jgi:hypothetical protein